MRQMLEELLSSLRHVAGSSEYEDQWPERARQAAKCDFIATVTHGVLSSQVTAFAVLSLTHNSHVTVAIVVRQCNMQKRSMMTKCEEAQSDTVKNVDETRVAGPLSEVDQALAVRVTDFLVINQSTFLKQMLRK